MHSVSGTDGQDEESTVGELADAPVDRGYLTDGEALFHIERTILDDPKGQLLVELEDCATLELIVCSARSVTELGLRPVKPLVLSMT
ncbi:MAG TPA: hypothetical protein VIJ39_13800 [Solirubrobacteraceae bacterium]